ncbi:MAG: hypothetical protein EPN37_12570 [Chitinophagaceae bacterium]|nr:MAG: hypothetical protein EPN37_12570 [Chitinophagaceae bacterium]
MDLFATIAGAAGAELPKDRQIDGCNILPWLKGEESNPDKEMYYFKQDTLQAVREGDWKLRYARNERVDNGNDILTKRYGKDANVDFNGPDAELTVQLYNLKIDPSEKYNVAGENPEIAARLMNKLEKFAVEVKAHLDK